MAVRKKIDLLKMTDDERYTLKNIEGKVIDDFEILERFSGGGFSVVHFAKHLPTNTYCAAKVIDLDVQTTSGFNGIMREISVFMQVVHPNMTTFFRLSFRDPLLIFFMEYSPNGTLLSYVNKEKGLEEKEARRLFIQLFSVLRHVHTMHFLVHRDLKLENILLDKNNDIKLIDFGLGGTFYNNTMRTFVGSPGYQPPEILAGREYCEKCDVWSLGICLYAMLTGNLPFTIQTICPKTLLQEAEEFQPPPGVSPCCADFMKKMLQGRVDGRPTLLQLQSHPWLHGTPPMPSRLEPTPIVFYRITEVEDIAKFRRKPVHPDPHIIERCENEFGVNGESLKSAILAGEISRDTTLYWVLTNPLLERPTRKMPNQNMLPPLPPLAPSLSPQKRNKKQKRLSATLSPCPKHSTSRFSVNNVMPKLTAPQMNGGYRQSLGLRQLPTKSSRIV